LIGHGCHGICRTYVRRLA